MIGLPAYFRFGVLNQTGITIPDTTITIAMLRRRIGTDGQLVYEGSASNSFVYGDVVQGAYVTSTFIDNSADKWLSGDFMFSVNLGSGSPNGQVLLYLERSTGADWPTALLGTVVAKLAFTAAANLSVDFSL